MTGNSVLNRLAEPTLRQVRALYAQRQAFGEHNPIRLYEEFQYAAGSWHKPFRVVLKAEVIALGDNPRFVVTSMRLPKAQAVYAELYCARGQADRFDRLRTGNFIKQVKCDLASSPLFFTPWHDL